MKTKKKKKRLTKLVIDRKRWLRGVGSEDSYLRHEDTDKMCCLGFLGVACGINPKSLRGISTPREVKSKKWPKWLVPNFQDELAPECTQELMVCNDYVGSSEEYREARITELFKKQGIKVTFKG